MIILIAGGTHTGKTKLAQELLERYRYPYLSIDHLKMGLIRSGYCSLTPESGDEELTQYLWPVVREMIRTNLENRQNLIVEGCYIPFSWQRDFSAQELKEIRFLCLIFSRNYVLQHFQEILAYEDVIEKRLSGGACTREQLLQENERNLAACQKYGCPYVLVEDRYEVKFAP